MQYKMNIREYKKEDLEEFLKSSSSYSEFLGKIGYAKSGNGYKFTQNYLKNLGLDISSVINKRWDSTEKSVEESFVINGKFATKELKSKILKYKLKEYKCEICANKGEWMGITLSLHLDHINGIRDDNRLCNLRFLCPNCHSQTGTYSGKNKLK